MIKWEVIVCAKEVINGEDLYDWETIYIDALLLHVNYQAGIPVR